MTAFSLNHNHSRVHVRTKTKLLTVGRKAEEETQAIISKPSVTLPFLSVCFRASGLCRQMLASVFYHKLFPIRLTKGRVKESHRHEFIKTSTHYHTVLSQWMSQYLLQRASWRPICTEQVGNTVASHSSDIREVLRGAANRLD